MSPVLKDHIQKFVSITGEEAQAIAASFQTIHLKKKQNILEEGQLCRQHYFVEKGIVRMFYVNEKGVEHTTQFALEGWWITDLMSFQNRQPTGFYIQAVEAATLLAIDFDAQETLLKQYPVMERYFRIIFQKVYAANQLRIKYLYDYSSEEMYDQFARQNPAFVQRIPQYLLASFLGFTPEYLSELRRKKLS